MFKDKVKVTVVALVMVLLMVLSVTTDLFIGLADVFRARAAEATPTDATPVTRDVTVYKELGSSDEGLNLAGTIVKVYKDSACTQSITEFVLSYDGKSYGGDDRVVYKSLEERANANASKAIAKLQEDTYYYQLDEKLFRSNDDYSKTGYDYNNTVGSFSIVAGDGVQEIKLDNDMFRPTEKVATPTDASSEVSTEVTTEAVTEPDTQVATTSDASSEETEATTQVATPTDSIPEVKPVATLASVLRMAKAAKAAEDVYIYGSESSGCGNYHITAENGSANSSLNGDLGSRTFCVDWGANGPSAANNYTRPVKYRRGSGAIESMRKVVAYYYDVLVPAANTTAKKVTALAETEHYLSALRGNKGATPSWASAALNHVALAKGDQAISISNSKPTVTCVDSKTFGTFTEKNVFVSEKLTVTAKSDEQYFNYEVPNGCTVYVHRNKTWYKLTADDKTHTLRKNDIFYVVTPKSNANKTFSISGTAVSGGWDVYYYEPNDPAWLGCQEMMLAAETDKPKFTLKFKTEELPDPINIVIDKVDSIREDGTQVGKTSLAGAIFKMEYFKGKTAASGTPTNTWYIKTVKNAVGDYTARFDKTCLVTGDKNYPSDTAPKDIDPTGLYELYDGAMRITEVKAPSGYKVVDGKNKGFFKVKQTKVTGSSITVRVTGGKTIYAGAEITADAFKQYEQKERYDFKLKKVDSYGNPMAGVAFLVTASNGDQHVVVTDKNGEFDSSKLGYTNVNGKTGDSFTIESINGAKYTIKFNKLFYEKHKVFPVNGENFNNLSDSYFYDFSYSVAYDSAPTNDRQVGMFDSFHDNKMISLPTVRVYADNCDTPLETRVVGAKRVVSKQPYKEDFYLSDSFNSLDVGYYTDVIDNRLAVNQSLQTKYVRFVFEFPDEFEARTDSEWETFNGKFLVFQIPIEQREVE